MACANIRSNQAGNRPPLRKSYWQFNIDWALGLRSIQPSQSGHLAHYPSPCIGNDPCQRYFLYMPY